MKCTIHSSRELVPTETQYGVRYSCPVGGCTVVLWAGSTSTPADYETRQVRIRAHDAFDRLWKSGSLTRYACYRQLAKYLKLSREQVHIGMFDIKQCEAVIQFSEAIVECKL